MSQQPKVLVIDDEPGVRELISESLRISEITAVQAADGLEALSLLRREKFDLLILDINMPKLDGLALLEKLRAEGMSVPVLMLSARADKTDINQGLRIGADDYLTKPFNKDELIARIHAIVRRSKGHSESVVRFDKVGINLDTRNVEVNGVQVHLTNKEYAILELLAMRKGSVLTKEMFLNHLYSSMDEPEIKIIDVFVCKLRKKLANASGGGVNYIETVWGRGYMLKDNESNENKIETFKIPQIEKSQDQQVETIEISQVDIPKKNIFQAPAAPPGASSPPSSPRRRRSTRRERSAPSLITASGWRRSWRRSA